MAKNKSWFVLPDNNQVSNWGQNFLPLQKVAYSNYLNIDKNLYDTELSKIICEKLDWNQYNLASYNNYIIDLGEQAFVADIVTSYTNVTNVKNVIDSIGPKTPIQLLVWSYFNNSRVIYIPKNFISNKTIILSSCMSGLGAPSPNNIILENIIFIIEPGAQLNINIQQGAVPNLLIQSITGFIGENSQVNIVTNINNNYSLSEEDWYIGAHASLEISQVISGNKNYQIKNYNLIGESAQLNYQAITSLNNQNQVVLNTTQNHLAAYTKSNVNVKAVLESSSRFFYRGKIEIADSAKKSESNQQQKSLILSQNALNCSIPSLEIKTDDVQCRHGSAASNISQEYLWYLKSRGIDEDRAKNILIDAFLH